MKRDSSGKPVYGSMDQAQMARIQPKGLHTQRVIQKVTKLKLEFDISPPRATSSSSSSFMHIPKPNYSHQHSASDRLNIGPNSTLASSKIRADDIFNKLKQTSSIPSQSLSSHSYSSSSFSKPTPQKASSFLMTHKYTSNLTNCQSHSQVSRVVAKPTSNQNVNRYIGTRQTENIDPNEYMNTTDTSHNHPAKSLSFSSSQPTVSLSNPLSNTSSGPSKSGLGLGLGLGISSTNIASITTCRPGDVSDNYQRLNLKKQFKGYRKVPVRRNANDESNSYDDGDSDGDCNRETTDTLNEGTQGLASAKTSSVPTKMKSRKGPESYGVDTMQVALEDMKKLQSRKNVSGNEKTSVPSKKTAQLLAKMKSTSSLSSIDSTSIAPRGLLAPKFRHRQRVQSKAAKQSRQKYGGLDDEALQDIAPKCSGHDQAAKLLVVKKTGSINKGRRFYGCSYPSDQRCTFFQWAEQNTELVSLLLQKQQLEEQETLALGAEAAFRRSALRVYESRLLDMTTEEMKEEVRRCKQRRNLEVKRSVETNAIVTCTTGNVVEDDASDTSSDEDDGDDDDDSDSDNSSDSDVGDVDNDDGDDKNSSRVGNDYYSFEDTQSDNDDSDDSFGRKVKRSSRSKISKTKGSKDRKPKVASRASTVKITRKKKCGRTLSAESQIQALWPKLVVTGKRDALISTLMQEATRVLQSGQSLLYQPVFISAVETGLDTSICHIATTSSSDRMEKKMTKKKSDIIILSDSDDGSDSDSAHDSSDDNNDDIDLEYDGMTDDQRLQYDLTKIAESMPESYKNKPNSESRWANHIDDLREADAREWKLKKERQLSGLTPPSEYNPESISHDQIHRVLESLFGHSSFRHGQL